MNIKKKLYLLLAVIFFLGCAERKVVVTDKVLSSQEKLLKLKALVSESLENNPVDESFTTFSDAFGDGSPLAEKGGRIVFPLSEYPATLRTVGSKTNHVVSSLLDSLVYETLLSIDYETLEYKPALASHWKISEDKKTFYFRINPKAHWADGYPVTAYDVAATFKLLTDEGIASPSTSLLYSESFYPPEILDALNFKVSLKKVNWRSFLYFSGMSVLPAHHLEKVTGATYLKKYQKQMMPGTGPYEIDLEQSKRPKKIVLKRRDDYWGDALKANQGLYNFSEIEFKIVRDERLMLEKFKKGEIDVFIPSRARWWIEELKEDIFPELTRGLVLKRKIFNYKPLGTSGLALNTLSVPFNDIRLRKALCMLWNIDELIENMFFNEYVRCTSYFQGTLYENNENKKFNYDPLKAIKLLEESGWELKPGKEYREKEGEILNLKLMINPSYNRVFTPLQQSLKKAGIKLDLINMTGQAVFEKIMNRKFQLAFLAWTGMMFPNPETSMHSKYAEASGTNNITGMSDPLIDSICESYDKSFKASERIELLKKLDKLAVDNVHYAFGWVAPYAARVAFKNKFSYPPHCLGFAGDWRAIFAYWWHDSAKNQQYKQALKNKELSMDKGEEIIDFFNKL